MNATPSLNVMLHQSLFRHEKFVKHRFRSPSHTRGSFGGSQKLLPARSAASTWSAPGCRLQIGLSRQNLIYVISESIAPEPYEGFFGSIALSLTSLGAWTTFLFRGVLPCQYLGL